MPGPILELTDSGGKLPLDAPHAGGPRFDPRSGN